MLNDNLKDLFSNPNNDDELRRQVVALRSMVIRLCQEVDALQSTLSENGSIDQERFRERRKHNMLEDHSSMGPHPWTAYSYYRFIVSEEEYLRTWLGLSEEEVARFSSDVEHIQTLT